MRRPRTMRSSCRLMTATWSCPVLQMCDRKRWYLCSLRIESIGAARVRLSLRISTLDTVKAKRTVNMASARSSTDMMARHSAARSSMLSKTKTDASGDSRPSCHRASAPPLTSTTSNC
eukprot:scaffold1440_cov114-Isochrysis_galbana.AAC.6